MTMFSKAFAFGSAAFLFAAATGLRSAGAFQWFADPAPPEQTPPGPSLDAAQVDHHYKDGRFTGPVTDAYYGEMQVEATIQGGRIVAVDVLRYPNDRRASRSINNRALPQLESEVIGNQSTRVHAVSGATLTSRAYLRSLETALADAGV